MLSGSYPLSIVLEWVRGGGGGGGGSDRIISSTVKVDQLVINGIVLFRFLPVVEVMSFYLRCPCTCQDETDIDLTTFLPYYTISAKERVRLHEHHTQTI